jgi:mRNA-degrading endonuclease RelE of RelBE toxin-antitoxin system
MYRIEITKTALKDIKKLTPQMKSKLKDILENVVASTPHEGKKLLGDLEGNFSLRLNLKDRIVYSVDEEKKIVYLKRAKTHYGD